MSADIPRMVFLMGKLEAYTERLYVYLKQDRDAVFQEPHKESRASQQMKEVEDTLKEVRALRGRVDQ